MHLLCLIMLVKAPFTTVEEFCLALDSRLGVLLLTYFYSEFCTAKVSVNITQKQYIEHIMTFAVEVVPRLEMA